MLPDNVLLETFHFYKDDVGNHAHVFTWRWKTLAQVCRRWRHVVFGSPQRLDLCIVCTSTTPTSRSLDIWPPFPIIVSRTPSFLELPEVDENGVENLIAALECRDRISVISIKDIRGPVLEKLITVLHEPLPVLTHFLLKSTDELMPALPETFLGGFAPRLRSFWLKGIPFSSFPKFILSFAHISALHLLEIPSSGYIPPEVMATCLAALPNLNYLSIEFRSPPPRPLRLSPPHLTRAALPALYGLDFSGVSEYFEDFVARIDAPCLTRLRLAFFMDLIFDIPRLRNFIDHAEGLKLFDQAAIKFSSRAIRIVLGPFPVIESLPRFELEIRCERLDWQLSSMTHIFSQQLPLLSHVEQVRISEFRWESFEWKDDPDVDSSQWLEVFRLFVTAQSLHVSEGLVPPVARALQDLSGQMAMEVLPALQTLFLEGLQSSGPVHEATRSFATARQLSHQPAVIQRWEREEPRQ